MNNTFNPGRFGKYFLYDLRNAKNNFGLSLIILGCLPIIVFVFYQIIYRLFSGGSPSPSIGNQISAMATAFAVVVLSFPVKVYGGLTDKKEGSSWLMIPASGFEKWLSMILVSCVVLPLCFFALLFGTDALLAAVFPSSWPTAIVRNFAMFNEKLVAETDGLLRMNVVSLILAEWPETILLFTLGAITFKKAKTAKTFLALFLLSVLFSLTAAAFNINITIDNFNSSDADVVRLVHIFRTFIWSMLAVWTAMLMAGTFARIKTLKH